MSFCLSVVYFLVYQIPHTIHILQYLEVGWKRAIGFPGKHNWKLAHSASAALLKLYPHSVLVFSINIKTKIRKYNCKLLMQCPIFIYILWSSTVHYLAFSEWFLFPSTVLSDFELYIRMAQKQMKQHKWTYSRLSENKWFINVFPGLIILIPLYWKTSYLIFVTDARTMSV